MMNVETTIRFCAVALVTCGFFQFIQVAVGFLSTENTSSIFCSVRMLFSVFGGVLLWVFSTAIAEKLEIVCQDATMSDVAVTGIAAVVIITVLLADLIRTVIFRRL